MKNSLYLPAYEQIFLDENEELLPAMVAPGVPPLLVQAVCNNFRRAGIASLLQTGRSRVFRLRLQRSGRAFAHFLAQADPSDKLTSQSRPLLDSLGAGDFDTAVELAQTSRHDWSADAEYEEEFLFYEFLMQSQLLGMPKDQSGALLDRWEVCLEGTEDLRLPVCRALHEEDDVAFNAALTVFLKERAKEYLRERSRHDPEVMATEASIAIEGVAFARLARRRGLPGHDEYPQVPSVALDNEALAWRKDSFRDLS